MRAIFPYDGEDLDELSFEAGDLIDVIPFADPEDQVRSAFISSLNSQSVTLLRCCHH